MSAVDHAPSRTPEVAAPTGSGSLVLEITMFPDTSARKLQARSMTWEELCESLANPQREYATKAACPLLKLAKFGDQCTPIQVGKDGRKTGGSLRNDQNVVQVFGIEGDYDAEEVTIDQAADRLAAQGVAAFFYTSARHTPKKPRWRVLAPLARPCAPEARRRYVGLLNAALGGILAAESFTLSQTYFIGRVRGAQYATRQVPGAPVDSALDSVMEPQYPAPKAARSTNEVPSTPALAGVSIDRLALLLQALPERCRSEKHYDEWFRALAAVHHETGGSAEGLTLVDAWSAQGTGYRGTADVTKKWESFGKRSGGPTATLRTLEAMVDHDDPDCAAGWASYVAEEFEAQPAAASAKRPPRFVEMDLAGIEEADQVAPRWFWHGYMPENEATLLAADGGAGKSTLALMLAACMAVGADCLGRETMRARVAYFSAEDPAAVVLRRLAQICRLLELDPGLVRQQLRVLDATDGDPVLFTEHRAEGLRKAAPTPTMHALGAYLDEHAVEVLIVDNASDVFDADENSRPMVRAFVRSLVRLVRQRSGAVLLLAHVDKSTSRAGTLAGGAAYSGSTGWNNSVRSRLFLVEAATGRRELQHQKANLGPKLPPLTLAWPAGGLPAVVESSAPPRATADDLVPLLRALTEFYGRGEWVSTAPQAGNNAAKLLGRELGAAGRGDVFAMLRDAQRLELVKTEEYRTRGRHQAGRWALTAAGAALIKPSEDAKNDAFDSV